MRVQGAAGQPSSRRPGGHPLQATARLPSAVRLQASLSLRLWGTLTAPLAATARPTLVSEACAAGTTTAPFRCRAGAARQLPVNSGPRAGSHSAVPRASRAPGQLLTGSALHRPLAPYTAPAACRQPGVCQPQVCSNHLPGELPGALAGGAREALPAGCCTFQAFASSQGPCVDLCMPHPTPPCVQPAAKAVLAANAGLPVVCLENAGGIRTDIPAGDVTMGQVNSVLPFGNTCARGLGLGRGQGAGRTAAAGCDARGGPGGGAADRAGAVRCCAVAERQRVRRW